MIATINHFQVEVAVSPYHDAEHPIDHEISHGKGAVKCGDEGV